MDLPELATRTYTSTHRNSPEPSRTCLHQRTPELSGTFQSLQPYAEPTPARTRTLRNLPEPAGTYASNSPEPSGTCNLPGLPTYTAHAATLRNLPELASGTHTSTHRNSPEPSGTCLRNLLLRPAPEHTGAYLGWRPLWLTLLGKNKVTCGNGMFWSMLGERGQQFIWDILIHFMICHDLLVLDPPMVQICPNALFCGRMSPTTQIQPGSGGPAQKGRREWVDPTCWAHVWASRPEHYLALARVFTTGVRQFCCSSLGANFR